MAELCLVEGGTALVDQTDLAKVEKYHWHIHPKLRCAFAHAYVSGKKRTILLHRTILPVAPHVVVKFKNSNRLDSRRQNLIAEDRRSPSFYLNDAPCACGCGQRIKPWKHGTRTHFAPGHQHLKYHSDAERLEAKRLQSREFARRRAPVVKAERKRLKTRAMALFGNKCAFCATVYNGKNGPIFEFHHLDPKMKDSNMNKLFSSGNWSEIAKEVRKCCLTCANCHNLFHGGEW